MEKKINFRRIIILLAVSVILFNIINLLTAQYGQQVDGCDEKGFPLRYYITCANEGGLPVSPDNPQGFLWYCYTIDFLLVLLTVVLFSSIGKSLQKLNPQIKSKIGITVRTLALLGFCALILSVFVSKYVLDNLVLIFGFTLIYLLVLSQKLHPIKKVKQILILLGMIGFTALVYCWANDIGYQKKFSYEGETLAYDHSPFNGSFNKFFKANEINPNDSLSLNEHRKKYAIEHYIHQQCRYYENDLDRYDAAFLENHFKDPQRVLRLYEYKGNLREFIIDKVKNNPEYLENYLKNTGQNEVRIELILKHSREIFNIYDDSEYNF